MARRSARSGETELAQKVAIKKPPLGDPSDIFYLPSAAAEPRSGLPHIALMGERFNLRAPGAGRAEGLGLRYIERTRASDRRL